VSDNDRSHFTGTTELNVTEGAAEKTSLVLKRLQKTRRNDADVTWRGSSFQTRAAATRKARSPTVDSRVRRTITDDAERRRPWGLWTGGTRQSRQRGRM